MFFSERRLVRRSAFCSLLCEIHALHGLGQGVLTKGDGDVEKDVLNRIEKQFIERLGLDRIPRPIDSRQLRHVPDFLEQLLSARSRVMTSSCPGQSPLSAVALSPSVGQLMFTTYLITYLFVIYIFSALTSRDFAL